MKKIFILFFSLVLLMTGCSSENDSIGGEPKKLEKDTILTSFENYDITLYSGFTSTNAIRFYIASSKPLEDSLDIGIDIETPYNWSVTNIKQKGDDYADIEGYTMSYFTYLSYKDYDFEKLVALENKAYDKEGKVTSKEAFTEYENYLYLYMNDYEQFTEKNYYKNNYFYVVELLFDMTNKLRESEYFEVIKVVVDSKEHSFSIGRVTLDYTSTLELERGNWLQSQTILVDGKEIKPNTEGLIKIDDFTFDCTEDITLKGFRTLNDSIEIEKVSIVSEDGAVALDKIYNNGEAMDLKKNSVITPTITVKDKNFISAPNYSTIIYLITDYEYNGRMYSDVVQAQYMTHHDFGEVIAIRDGIDLMPYYDSIFLNSDGGIQ